MGGSVKAPAPDPALAEANIESLRTQADIGRRSLANAESLQPTQLAQMQFGLDAAKQGYEQTQADRTYALGKRDLYDKAVGGVISDADKFDEAVRRNELMSEAKADISEQYSTAQDQMNRGLQRAGVMPSSGKALLMQQSGELAEAAAKSRASVAVSEAAKKEGLQLKGQVASMLSGAPAQAASLTPTGVNLGVMGLDTTNTAAGGMNAGFGAADSAVASYGKMAGDQYSAQNKLYYDAEAANDKRNSEVYGAGLGLAGMGAYKGYKNYGISGSPFSSTKPAS
jgi:hypothetical protein